MIGSVVKEGGYFHAYDTNGNMLCSINANEYSELQGYTSTTINIFERSLYRKGGTLETYNEKGERISTREIFS
ncbi:MAG: hypothetical protein K6G09_05925 [Treponema sp.]|nr:hypothetical protein [Treponema sp.]